MEPPRLRGLPAKFQVVFVQGTPPWHESVIEVADEEPSAETQASRPRMVLAITPPPNPLDRALELSEARNICSASLAAEREEKSVKFLLRADDTRLRYSWHEHRETNMRPSKSISLRQFLVASANAARSRRVSIKPRVRLALIVASATLQLSSTQWCGKAWSKDSIYFIVTGHPAGGPFRVDATPLSDHLADVDLARPMTSMIMTQRLLAERQKVAGRNPRRPFLSWTLCSSRYGPNKPSRNILTAVITSSAAAMVL